MFEVVLVATLNTHRCLATFRSKFALLGGGECFAVLFHDFVKGAGHIFQGNAVLRAFGACKACFYLVHIQAECVSEHRLVTRLTPQALGFAVSLNQRDLAIFTTG